MKEIALIPFLLPVIYSDSLWARSIKSTITRMNQEAQTVGYVLGGLGLTVGFIMLTTGKQDATKYIMGSMVGTILVSLSPSIVKMLRSMS